LIAHNQITTPAEGFYYPTKCAPNEIMAGWYFDMSGTFDAAKDAPVEVSRNKITTNGKWGFTNSKKRKEGTLVQKQKFRGGDQRRPVVRARKVFCRVAVKRMGYSGAPIARFLGVNTSPVNRYASSEGLGNLDQFL
jgi:hypothetical protein